MPTLSQNITNTITYLDEIRDAIIDTGLNMPQTERVSNYKNWIKRLIPMTLHIILVPGESFPSTGGSIRVVIRSNTSWIIKSDANWITISQNSGTGDAEVTLTAEENVDAPRTARLTIGSLNLVLTNTYLLTQARRPDTLNVSPTHIDFTNHPEETAQVLIQSNEHWTTTVTGNFAISPTEGGPNSSTIATVSKLSNTDGTGTIIVTTDYDKLQKTITITQQQ